jgi:hypothetical protein
MITLWRSDCLILESLLDRGIPDWTLSRLITYGNPLLSVPTVRDCHFRLDIFTLLWCYEAQIVSFPTFRDDLSVSSQGSISPEKTAWSLKMGPTGCSETSVTRLWRTLRNIPEERLPHWHCSGSPSHIIQTPLVISGGFFWLLCGRIAHSCWRVALPKCIT